MCETTSNPFVTVPAVVSNSLYEWGLAKYGDIKPDVCWSAGEQADLTGSSAYPTAGTLRHVVPLAAVYDWGVSSFGVPKTATASPRG
jgi:hypothetical protein